MSITNFLKKSWPFLALTVLAFIIHFTFLSYPAQVVFDEVHFGKFVGAYFTGQYYFDIHPPLGKLMIAGVAKVAGLNPAFEFDHIGQQASPHLFFVLRFLPAFFGALFVLLMAWFAWLLTKSKQTALIAGILSLLDTAVLVQSKFILMDVFLLFFGILAICFFLLSQRHKIWTGKWFLYVILTGIAAGLTASIKWTGLAVVGVIGLAFLLKIFSPVFARFLSGLSEKPFLKFKESFLALAIILLAGFTVYLIPFVIHFKLLPHSGSGDAFMSQSFQRELSYGSGSLAQPLTFWQKFKELNKTMYTANAGITATHPYGSRWYSWPVDYKPIYYWNQDNMNVESLFCRTFSASCLARIYFMGNPVLWLMALAAVIASLFKITNKKDDLKPVFWLLLFAYLANLLPFMLIKRVAFLYHYLPASIFAVTLLAIWLARLWPNDKKILYAALGLIALFFILFIPFTYGLPLSPSLAQCETELVNPF